MKKLIQQLLEARLKVVELAKDASLKLQATICFYPPISFYGTIYSQTWFSVYDAELKLVETQDISEASRIFETTRQKLNFTDYQI